MNRPHHTTTESTGAEAFRQRLVASMRASGALHSSPVLQAFLRVPREAFVPFFYERLSGTNKMRWAQRTWTQMSASHWLEELYQDEPLVTRLDARGIPCSSSSCPSAMARMLEALQVQPGQRVLEVGTGTGYNAALLACLALDPHLVTTIEIEQDLAHRANQALQDVLGSGVTVVAGDGREGYAPHAPYERIILTASYPCVARAWYEQLAPGGTLVMDLRGDLGGGFLVLEKDAAGRAAHGRFLSTPLYFMPIFTRKDVPLVDDFGNLLRLPRREAVTVTGHPFPEILKDASFLWWLQWRLPGCSLRTMVRRGPHAPQQAPSLFVVDHVHDTILRFQQSQGGDRWQGHVHGSRPLWSDLYRTYQEWVELGRPGPEMYHLEMTSEQTEIVIETARFTLSAE